MVSMYMLSVLKKIKKNLYILFLKNKRIQNERVQAILIEYHVNCDTESSRHMLSFIFRRYDMYNFLLGSHF